MSRDHHDALIEQLLRESMGGDRPRDLTPRVMALAHAHDRSRRAWWISAGAAMAAGIVLALSIWTLWPERYPTPVIGDGIVTVEGDARFDRGTDLVSPLDASATIHIGGYVRGTVAPNTVFAIIGSPRREVVQLRQGQIDFDVTKKRGTFDVRVGPATVQVTGTSFSVNVTATFDGNQRGKRLLVSVREGSVNVVGLGKTRTLNANESEEFTIPGRETSLLQEAPNLVVPAVDPAPPQPAALQPATPQVAPVTTNNAASPGAPANNQLRATNPGVAPAATRAQRVELPATARAARGGLAQRTAAQAPRFVETLVITGAGPTHIEGTLRRVNDGLLVLMDDQGNLIQLGTVESLRGKIQAIGVQPGQQTRLHVVFEKGNPTSISPVPQQSRPATRAAGQDR